MKRLQRVARVQLTNWAQLIGWPVMILAISFLFNLALFASMGDDMDNRSTGGIVSIYIMQIIMCSIALAQVFSFAVGLNVTRRTFYLAQSLVVIGQSLLYGVLLYVLDVVEQLTNGWGIHLTYFSIGTAVDGYSPLSIVIYAVPMVLCSYVGLMYGVISKRWGNAGVIWASVLAGVVLGTVAVLVTLNDRWPSVGSWLQGQSGVMLAAGWTLLPLVALAAGSYTLLRRAIP
jgi:hypothetical protein